MTPHDTPAGPGARRLWQDAQTYRQFVAAFDRIPDSLFPRVLLGSPEEAAKLLQEVAPDDRR